jgi:hypothetical protein
MVGPAPLRVVALMLAVLAVTFAVGSVGLGFWVDEIPGPGLLSFATAVLLLPVLAALFWSSPIAEDEPGFDFATLFALPLICVYALVVPYAGLVPGTIVLVVLWVRFFHRQNWLRAATLAVCLVAAFAVLFKFLLAAPIPLFPEWS